jgi:hypothetical protein
VQFWYSEIDRSTNFTKPAWKPWTNKHSLALWALKKVILLSMFKKKKETDWKTPYLFVDEAPFEFVRGSLSLSFLLPIIRNRDHQHQRQEFSKRLFKWTT